MCALKADPRVCGTETRQGGERETISTRCRVGEVILGFVTLVTKLTFVPSHHKRFTIHSNKLSRKAKRKGLAQRTISISYQ